LSAFPNSWNAATSLGLCATYYSLPYQWESARKLGVSVPSYCLTSDPNYKFLDHEIRSDLFNYCDWSRHQDDGKSLNFNRPSGAPYLVGTFGNHQRVENVSGTKDDAGLQSELSQTARTLSSALGSDFNEQVYFVQNNKFTFGSLNPGIHFFA